MTPTTQTAPIHPAPTRRRPRSRPERVGPFKLHHAVIRKRSMEKAARKGELPRLHRERVANVSGERFAELVAQGRAYAAPIPELDIEARKLGLRPEIALVARAVYTVVAGFGNRAVIASHLDFAHFLNCSRRKAGDVVRAATQLGYLEQQPWFVRLADGGELTEDELTAPPKGRPRGAEDKPHYRVGPRLRCLMQVRELRRFRVAVEAKDARAASRQVSKNCQPSEKEPRSPDPRVPSEGGRVPRHPSSSPDGVIATDDELDELEGFLAGIISRAAVANGWSSEPERPEAPEGGGS